MTKEEKFAALVGKVAACKRCARMDGSARVLTSGCGPLDAELVLVGEAPGRLGADDSQLPFHGDKSGHNFESLIDQVGISRYDVFVTNAVLCNPKDADGNNSTPTSKEIENCSKFLAEQISIIEPKIVATLGATALKASSLIEPHGLTLSTSVRTSHKWNNRVLVPCYHPGQRAMIHRSFANQLSDYQFLAETLRRNGKRRKVSPKPRSSIATKKITDVTRVILQESPDGLSYFALHKIMFLAEVAHMESHGVRLTNGYVLRQKDGPYYVDLHPAKLTNLIPEIVINNQKGVLRLRLQAPLNFHEATASLTVEEVSTLKNTIEKYGHYDNFKLKRRTYLTSPMRALLRKERTLKMNMFNAPLLCET